MASLSFTVDWEQEKASADDAGGVKDSENAVPSDSQDTLAWEINFEGADEGKPKKSTSMPKFLRERQQDHSGIPPSQPIKSNTPRGSPRPPGRSSSSPVKTQGAKSVSKSPLKSNVSPSRSHSAANTQESSEPGTSPKKSPAIKKSLLPMRSPVRSPVKKADKSPEMRSQSDCTLTVGVPKGASVDTSPSKGGVAKKKRPHSAAPSLGGSPRQVKSGIQRPSRGYSAGGGGATGRHGNLSKEREERESSGSIEVSYPFLEKVKGLFVFFHLRCLVRVSPCLLSPSDPPARTYPVRLAWQVFRVTWPRGRCWTSSDGMVWFVGGRV